MNRTLRAAVGAILIGIITFCAIIIFQNIGKSIRADITADKIYTLSAGTKSILGKMNQPLKMKLYYTKTAAMKGPDQIKFFNNYYSFVEALLQEYVLASKGLVKLEVIDPRPFSDEEADAMRYGLKRFPIAEEESFFFGLVVQTQYGVDKTIPFFSPDRQNFVEYDISYLIDTAITRQKKRLGVLSSLDIIGDDTSPYMAQMMRMQGQEPKSSWAIIEQLRGKYDVSKIASDTNDINDVDILLVVHPKDLSEKTLFAIDQFILRGGRAVVCLDPFCLNDKPDESSRRLQSNYKNSSSLGPLLQQWGLEMPENTFAGDRDLALTAAFSEKDRPQKIIALLGLNKRCFNKDNVISASLNDVRMLFAGVLNEAEVPGVTKTVLLSTTNKGNSWSVSHEELVYSNPATLMSKFSDGTKAVHMGYLATGKFKSAFPEGVKVPGKTDPNDPNKPVETKLVTGIKEASSDCAVAVFSDVDFISDMMAYQNSIFGKTVTGDNSALVINTIDDLAGSGDLISIRSRGNFRRPFAKVDKIEAEADKKTADEEGKINAEISGFQKELNEMATGAKGKDEELIGSTLLQKKKDIELKIHEAQMHLRKVKMNKRKDIEQIGSRMRNLNTLPGPIITLIIAVILGVRRSVRRRHYISHASDA